MGRDRIETGPGSFLYGLPCPSLGHCWRDAIAKDAIPANCRANRAFDEWEILPHPKWKGMRMGYFSTCIPRPDIISRYFWQLPG